LERERKVRLNLENENNLLKNQLKSIKDKSQQLIETLRYQNQELASELDKIKTDHQEMANQMQTLKRDMKNNVSVQEDLVKLNQSLQVCLFARLFFHALIFNVLVKFQIELEQTKSSEKELRCQHADDFVECSTCKKGFSATRVKVRCKHCCKIFCPDCCDEIVHSGPNLRPNKVCINCFRILDKDSSSSPLKT
jgi:hypothetical protein